jgi:hypothetical protein
VYSCNTPSLDVSHLICWLTGYDRCTLLNRKTHTAWNAKSTRSTRSLSTRRARTQPLLRARGATILSKEVSVVRPSQSSERRPRPPRRLPSSLSATPARSADARLSAVANHSCLERKKTPRVKYFSERTDTDELTDCSAWHSASRREDSSSLGNTIGYSTDLPVSAVATSTGLKAGSANSCALLVRSNIVVSP